MVIYPEHKEPHSFQVKAKVQTIQIIQSYPEALPLSHVIINTY